MPENLDLDRLLEIVPPFKAFHKDKIHYVCHAIYNVSLKLKSETLTYPGKQEKYYVPLNSRVLGYYITTNSCKDILRWMVAAGIIESDGDFTPGFLSIGYRFTPLYRDRMYRRVDVTSKALLNKKPYTPKGDNVVKSSSAVKKLFKWFKGLRIDEKAARATIERLYMEEMARNKKRKKHKRADFASRAENNRRCANKIVDFIVGGCKEKLPHQDVAGRRLHSVITMIPKYLRCYLSYKGQALCQTDISNSQLFCSIYLFNPENWKKNKLSGSGMVWKGLGIPSISSIVSNSKHNTIMYLTSNSFVDENQSQKAFQDYRFSYLILQNGIYAHLIDKMESINGFFKAGIDDRAKRRKVKRLLLAQMFANENWSSNAWIKKGLGSKTTITVENNAKTMTRHKMLYSGKNALLWKAFIEEFPRVYGLFKHIKANSYDNLARVLQRIESTAVLEYACKLISDKLPHVPIFPLHDCLVTTLEYLHEVDELFKEGVMSFVGCRPITSTTEWSECRFCSMLTHHSVLC